LFYFFRSTHVPVGHDQLQHIELSRDLANLFNKRYGETFLLPEPILTNTARIMSLRRPQEKMSKSDKSINSRIDLTDSNDSIALKIQKSLTDSEPYISHDLTERHGIRNLIDIQTALTGESKKDLIERYEGVEYFTRVLKEDTSDALIEHLTPIREKYNDLINDKSYLYETLRVGSERANLIASKTMEEIYNQVGMRIC